jgi:hypothetical protein
MPARSVQDLIKAGRGAGRAFVRAFGDERRMLGHQGLRYVVLTQQLQENLDAVREPWGELDPRLGDALPGCGRRVLRATRRATRRLLRAAQTKQPESTPASPPPALRIGPKT